MAENSNQAVKYCEPVTWNDSDVKLSPVLINNEPYFVAVEVCEALDIRNTSDAMNRLEDDEKLTSLLTRAGQQRSVNLVNESGLYHLIFISRKPEAKKFRKWVTSEVLPSIRRSGGYSLAGGKAIGRPRVTRGELVNAEIMNLLWLIGESLNHGDQKSVAIELGVSVQSVNRTLNGYNRSNRILMALYKRARSNREAYMLYHQPAVMADRLVNGLAVEGGNHLPMVKLDGSSGRIGNQNARKDKGGMR